MSDSSWHVELLLAKERLSLEQREHREYLARRRQDLEGELRTLHVEIAETVAQLKKVGRERVEFGDFRRLTPISPVWGLDRGIPLDRYYIHNFLARHRADVQESVREPRSSRWPHGIHRLARSEQDQDGDRLRAQQQDQGLNHA